MRLIDADALAITLKEISEKQGYDKISANVAETIDALIEDLNGTALCGFENAPTVRGYSEESIKVFRSKLNKWLFHNSESVCGNSMVDIDYLDGELDELFAELNLPWNDDDGKEPQVEARLITHATWFHSKETSDFREHWTCSHCNHDIIENPKFKNRLTGEPLNFVWCPYCGSKMSEEIKQ